MLGSRGRERLRLPTGQNLAGTSSHLSVPFFGEGRRPGSRFAVDSGFDPAVDAPTGRWSGALAWSTLEDFRQGYSVDTLQPLVGMAGNDELGPGEVLPRK